MTLAELGMAFWHDLAAPVIAGILASMIVNWLNKRIFSYRRRDKVQRRLKFWQPPMMLERV